MNNPGCLSTDPAGPVWGSQMIDIGTGLPATAPEQPPHLKGGLIYLEVFPSTNTKLLKLGGGMQRSFS